MKSQYISVIIFAVVSVLPGMFCALLHSGRNSASFRSPITRNIENNTDIMVPLAREPKAHHSYREPEGHAEGPVPSGMSEHHGAMMMGGGDTKTKSKKKKSDLLSKILPFMVMPFLISSSLIPMVLTSLKLMLLKSLFVGKVAIFLLALNFLWKSGNKGGVYSHNVNLEHEQKDLHMAHYGFNGDEEYGAYVNSRSSGYR